MNHGIDQAAEFNHMHAYPQKSNNNKQIKHL